ncbi:transposase, partial [Escherichia coli]|uniref:transposase n=1 Tax=Escherichia coli TaxID=562 RepID=UPI001EEF6E35
AICERFNRTLREQFIEFNEILLFEDLALFNQKLAEYLVLYNSKRPHKALALMTPFKREQKLQYVVDPYKFQLKRKLDEDEVGQRLLSIPCVGTLTASTISTEIGDGKQYASSRDFAAATGLVPRQYSTGGRTTLLGISKRGNKKIRTLLVQCARVFIQKLEHQSGRLADWVRELLCRKSNFVVTCALANKLARIAWALTTRQQTYEA